MAANRSSKWLPRQSLAPVDWQTLNDFSGDGTVANVTNQTPASSSCFYCVVAQ